MVTGFKTPIRAGRRSGLRRALGSLIGGDRARVTWGPYASLAAAEASGDSWVTTDIIEITSGPDFVYHAALKRDDHSGLIHRYPFNDGVEYTPDPIVSGGNEDPDNWTGWTDIGTGTKGVDYDHAFSSSKARFQKLTSSGEVRYEGGSAVAAGDEIMFQIVRGAIKGTGTQSAGTFARFFLGYYIDESTTGLVGIIASSIRGGGVNWAAQTDWFATWVDTGKSFSVARRIHHYVKAGRQCLWFDEDSTPSINTTSVPSNAGSPYSRCAFITAGEALAGTAENALDAIISGRLSVS